ncbi:MAG: hypothetical protein OHK0028_04390 [Deltaproteobacteria bacterium]
MRRRIVFPLLAAAALLPASSGCGYRLQSANERLSSPSTRIDVSPFSNDSTTPDAGAWVAARLREELRRGGFPGTFGKTSPDYLVEGKVREIRESVFSHGSDRFALENRLTLFVDLRVVEVLHGRVLWKEAGLSETTSFFAGPDAQYTEANRRAAFEEAARRIARRISQTLRVLP